MATNDNFHDPFCRKQFWQDQLRTKTKRQIEQCVREFDEFLKQIEHELRVVMSASRAEVCRQVLGELLREKTREYKNKNQGDLFAE